MAVLNFQSTKSLLRDGASSRLALAVLFAALLAFNSARALHHAMWRDEMFTFLLGAYSPSLPELIRNLAHEPHPYLWHVIVWIGAHIYPDPIAQQVIHILLASAVWLLIWRAAPFRPVDKVLLLLSYFLFWEYFVISRNYALVALIGFAFVIVRTRWPHRVLLSFVLLGTLANTMVLGTIWSMVAAARLALERTAPLSVRVAGSAVYLLCLAVAVFSLIPAPDSVPGAHLRLNAERLWLLASVPAGALFPVEPKWLLQAAQFLLQAGSEPPHFWNPNLYDFLLRLAPGESGRIVLVIGLLLSPPLLCGWLVRDWKITAEFTLVYLGILSFTALWGIFGQSRQFGIIFLALVAAVWTASTRAPLIGWRAAGWRAVLIISAVGGLLTLTSEARVFSHGRTVAAWLTRVGLADAFIMGSRDTTLATISGYLARPMYYLECECVGRFIVFNHSRTWFIDEAEIMRRTNRTPIAGGGKETILITNREIPADVARRHAPDRTVVLLRAFTGAEVGTENYWVFRVTAKP